MDLLTAVGPVGVLVVVFWVVAGFMIPFFIWGIHSKVSRISGNLEKSNRLLSQLIGGDATQVQSDDQLRDL